MSGAVTQPVVSVLVPAYNHAAWITDCLESIRQESYPAIEIVVIDDGSTDATVERIAGWAEAHAEVDIRFTSRPNRGVTPTLNELLAMARGTYVTPLASDDMLVRGGIAARVRYLETHDGRRAVFGDCQVIDENGVVLAASALSELYGADLARLACDPSGEIISHWSVPGPVLLAQRAALLEIHGYDEELRVEDWDLYLRLASRGWIGFLDQSVAQYRRHGAGVSEHLFRDSRHAAERARVAAKALPLFDGRLRWLLLQQAAHWRAVASRIDGRPLPFVGWESLARGIRAATSIRRMAAALLNLRRGLSLRG